MGLVVGVNKIDLVSLQRVKRQTIERPWQPVRLHTTICLLIGIMIAPLRAGIRGPGKYSGVVFYDRWDNCILFDGVYLMYISEAVKEMLRSHQGQSVEIDAQEVYQPMNPGDGLIRKFTLLGSSVGKAGLPSITGIELKVTRDIADKGPTTLIVDIRNSGLSDISLYSGSLGFAVLASINKQDFVFNPSDGPSYAVITRASLAAPEGRSELRVDGDLRTYAWRIEQSYLLPRVLKLGVEQTLRTKVGLYLPRGEYQFIAGYAQDVMDGQCVMSNAVRFDIG